MKKASLYERRPTYSGNKKIQEIIEEYSLKKNLFNPNKPSPNKFLKKLEYRMTYYYNDIYKSFMSNKK